MKTALMMRLLSIVLAASMLASSVMPAMAMENNSAMEKQTETIQGEHELQEGTDGVKQESTEDTAGEEQKEDSGQPDGEEKKEDSGQNAGEEKKEDSGQSAGEEKKEDSGQSAGEEKKEDSGQPDGEEKKEDSGQTDGEEKTEDSGQNAGEGTNEDSDQNQGEQEPEQPDEEKPDSSAAEGEEEPGSEDGISEEEAASDDKDAEETVDAELGDTPTSGECGESLTWEYVPSGYEGEVFVPAKLVISGQGEMYDYDYDRYKAPWYDLLDSPVYGVYGNGSVELIINPGVTHIGDYAFYNAAHLGGDIDLPASVESVGEGAFLCCTGFGGTLSIGSVKTIGENAFKECKYLSGDLVIPEGCTLEKGAFYQAYQCSKLDSDKYHDDESGHGKLILPSDIETIPDQAFNGCTKFTRVTYGGMDSPDIGIAIPDSVTGIGECAFYDSNAEGKLIMPDELSSLGQSAFYGCDLLTGTLKIPYKLTEVANYTFFGCAGFDRLIFPDNSRLTSIGEGAFAGFVNLLGDEDGNLVIPQKVKYIGGAAFRACSNIKGELVIPEAVEEIDHASYGGYGDTSRFFYAFGNCTGFTKIVNQSKKASIDVKSMRIYSDGSYNRYVPNFMTDDYSHTPLDYVKPETTAVKGYIFRSDINFTGRACGTFRLLDQDGNPLKNTEFWYLSYENRDNPSNKNLAETDDEGYATIYANDLASSFSWTVTDPNEGRKEYYTTKLWVREDPGDVETEQELPYEICWDVTIHPLSYSQSWEGSVNIGAEVSFGPQVGGSAQIGPAKVEAEAKAGVGAKFNGAGSISVEDVHEGAERTLAIKQSYAARVGVKAEAKAGLEGKVGEVDTKLNLAEAEAEAGIGISNTVGLVLENYDAKKDYKEIGKFLFGISATGSGNPLLAALAELMGFDFTNYQESSVTADGSAGAKVLSAEFSTPNYEQQMSAAAAEVGYAGTYTHSKLDRKQAKPEITNCFEVKTNAEASLANLSGKYGVGGVKVESPVMDISLMSFKALSDYKFTTVREFHGTNYKGNRDLWGELKEVDYDIYLSKKAEGLFYDSSSIRRQFVFDMDKLNYSPNTIIDKFSKGQGGTLTKTAFEDIANAVDKSITYSDYKENNTTGKVKIGGSIACLAGLDVEFTPAYAYNLSCAIASGAMNKDCDGDRITMKTADSSDAMSYAETEAQRITLPAILDEAFAAAVDDAKEFLQEVEKSIKEGVEIGKAKIEKFAGNVKENLNVKITAVKDEWIKHFGVTEIYAYDCAEEELVALGEGELEEIEKIGVTVGMPYIITVTDDDRAGAVVEDFGDTPLSLVLSFDEEDMQMAGASMDEASALAIYKYSEDVLGFTYIGGTVNLENKCVTAQITKSGQYVLVLDMAAPSVEEITVTPDGSDTPEITVRMTDMDCLSTASIKLDGEECISLSENGTIKSEVKENYSVIPNRQADTVTIKITKPLALGMHTLVIDAADGAGHAMEQPYTYEFLVGVHVSQVSIDKSTLSVKVGETETLTATILPENATEKGIVWTSGDPSVATVDSNGLVTGISIGNTIITGTTIDKKLTVQCTVNVIIVHAKGVELDQNNLELKLYHSDEGESKTLTANVFPEDASDKSVTWISQNDKVAVVSETGVVTATGLGTTTIIAKTTDRGYTAGCKVVVTPERVTGISLDTESVTLNIDSLAVAETDKIKANIFPANAYDRKILWSSSDEKVATVSDEGVITAVDFGKCMITATSHDGEFTATCAVKVTRENFSTIEADTPGKNARGYIQVKLPKLEYVYTGNEIEPVPTITHVFSEYANGVLKTAKTKQKLTRNVDYTISYRENVKVGTAEIVLRGIGNYNGTITKTFKIIPKNAKGLTMENIADIAKEDGLTEADYENRIREEAIIKDNQMIVDPSDVNISIVKGTDKKGNTIYTVTALPAIGGNYTGYSPKAKTTVTLYDPKDKTDASTLQVTVTGGKLLPGQTIRTITYNGKAQKPKVSVVDATTGKKVKATDYKLLYSNNVNVGTASVTVIGKKNIYGKSKPVTFEIAPKDFSKVKVTALPKIYFRSSISDIKPIVKDGNTLLKENIDYTVSYQSMEEISLFGKNMIKLVVTITNQSNNYSPKGATKTVSMVMTKKSLASKLHTAVKFDKTKTDAYGCPEITVLYNGVELTKAQDKYATTGDYYVIFNKKSRTAKITGIGNYSGSKTVKY